MQRGFWYAALYIRFPLESSDYIWGVWMACFALSVKLSTVAQWHDNQDPFVFSLTLLPRCYNASATLKCEIGPPLQVYIVKGNSS